MTVLACEPAAELVSSNALLTDLEELRERTRAIAAEKLPFGFDVETGYHGDDREKASLHAEENFVVSFQFTNALTWARMVPLGFDIGTNMDNREAAVLLWPLFHAVDDAGLPLGVAHGAQAELRWLARWFLRNLWNHPLFGKQVIEAHGYYPIRSCTMLESFAEGENPNHALKDITRLNAGHVMAEIESLFPEGLTKKQQNSIRFNRLNMHDPKVISYACEDATWCLWHHLHRWPKVKDSFIYKLEMSVLPLACDMADDGVEVDWPLLRAASREVRDFSERLLAEVIEDFGELAGEPLAATFNFNSSQQFSRLLYEKCGLPVLHRTDTGRPSVDAKHALPRLAARSPEVQKYLGWKKLHDLRLKFLDLWETKYCWAPDSRGHPNLLQHGTIAGRFSCESFNYQQSPKKYRYELRDGTKFSFNFRDAFIARKPGSKFWWELVLEECGATLDPDPLRDELGWYLIGFDYSQIELRVLAAEARETVLLEAFERGDDVHRLTAALMLGKPLEAVTDEERGDTGKRMNFAISYQMTPSGLAEQLGIPLAAAEALFAQWHAAYPRIGEYARRVVQAARASARRSPDKTGRVHTKFGRLVKIFEYANPNRGVQAGGDRTAGNAVIQGPATGDYVKVAMVRAVKALKAAGLDSRVRMVMNVHDALTFEARKDVDPAEVIRVLQPAVVYPVTGPGAAWPPMVAEWYIGNSWGSVKDVVVFSDGSVHLKQERPAPVAAVPEPEPATAEVLAAVSERVPTQSPEAASPPAEYEPRCVIVALPDSPGHAQATRFLEFLRQIPGRNTVVVRLPQGDAPVEGTSALSPEHEPQVATIFGGAAVHYDQGSVDAGQLTRNLAL
jgi:DNA polymerase I